MSGTGGDVSWRKADGWLSSLPCCDWFGVTCAEGSGELVKLRLADNDLHGTLPESLGLLGDLRELIIYGNSPGRGQTCEDPEAGCLTGTIPPNLGGLQKLEQLYLHYNRLSGTVPSLRGMAPSLRFIHIGGNVASRDCADPCGGLSGGLDWLAELTSLEEVLLWENRFSGPFSSAMEGLQRLVRSHDHWLRRCSRISEMIVRAGTAGGRPQPSVDHHPRLLRQPRESGRGLSLRQRAERHCARIPRQPQQARAPLHAR